jgi:hypothetical protein
MLRNQTWRFYSTPAFFVRITSANLSKYGKKIVEYA